MRHRRDNAIAGQDQFVPRSRRPPSGVDLETQAAQPFRRIIRLAAELV